MHVSMKLAMILWTVLFACVSRTNSYRYIMTPIQMKSHVADMAAIAVQLVSQGHEVTFLLPDQFPVPEELRMLDKNESFVDRIQIERYERPELGGPLDIEEIYENLTRMILEDRASQAGVGKFMGPLAMLECRRILMHNEALFERLTRRRFDMAVVDSIPMIQYFYLVPHRLGIPWITLTDLVDPMLVRVPWLPSFVPVFTTSFTETMTFSERLQNTLLMIVFAGFKIFPDPGDDIVAKYREYGQFGSLEDLASSSVLWITTRDVVLDYPKSSFPNMIDAGGLTVKPATGRLPPEIAEFADGAERGVIVVSFGSAAYMFPPAITRKFVSAFERLHGYRIFWRFGSDEETELPVNVMALKWLPQNELLAHSKTRLFITHCGNNGQFEALYHRVPMIGFPLNGDQPYNARRMEYKGYGIAMDIHEFTSDELLKNVIDVTTNSSYRENIGLASSIWRSSPQGPAARAGWWIEHVTKYGSKHLISSGNQLNLWQYFLIDVVAFLATVLGVAVACLWGAIRFLCRTVRKHTSSSKQKRQ